MRPLAIPAVTLFLASTILAAPPLIPGKSDGAAHKVVVIRCEVPSCFGPIQRPSKVFRTVVNFLKKDRASAPIPDLNGVRLPKLDRGEEEQLRNLEAKHYGGIPASEKHDFYAGVSENRAQELEKRIHPGMKNYRTLSARRKEYAGLAEEHRTRASALSQEPLEDSHVI